MAKNAPSIDVLCDGILLIRSNARSLLEESKDLFRAGHPARAYAIAYIACEELGKLPILVGAATRLLSGTPINWREILRRFRSHESKEIQFNGVDSVIPLIIEAVDNKTPLKEDKLLERIISGGTRQTHTLKARNAALYVDFNGNKFVAPRISATETTELHQIAERQLEMAERLFDGSRADIREKLEHHSKQYDATLIESAFAEIIMRIISRNTAE